MIRFKNLPSNDKAVDQMVKQMTLLGMDEQYARDMTDKSSSIVMWMLRDLDAKIDAATPDEADRSVIQQQVFHALTGIIEEAMRINAIQGLMHILTGK